MVDFPLKNDGYGSDLIPVSFMLTRLIHRKAFACIWLHQLHWQWIEPKQKMLNQCHARIRLT